MTGMGAVPRVRVRASLSLLSGGVCVCVPWGGAAKILFLINLPVGRQA